MENFNPEKIPNKIPIVRSHVHESKLLTAVYHAEAPYSLRRILIEQSKKHFREVERADTNAILSHSFQRQKMLDDRFEEMFIKSQKYGRGCQYQDANCRITFKTFLQE